MNFQLAGKYKFTVRKADLTLVSESEWIDNIITNQGLDAIGAAGFLYYCRVGTGTNTPAAGNVALQNSIALSNYIVDRATTYSASSPYYSARLVTWRFGVGAAAGNLSEVGVFIGSGPNTCASRALILDSGGDPTTITVLADEILDVTYEIRTYAMQTDATGNTTIDGVNYTWTARGAYAGEGGQWGLPQAGTNSGITVTAHTGAIAAVTAGPTGALGSVYGTAETYVTGTYHRDFTVQWPLESSNDYWASLRVYVTAAYAEPQFQIGLSPAFPKTASKVVDFVIRMTWARYAP